MTLYSSPLSVGNLTVLPSNESSKAPTLNASPLPGRGQSALLSDPFSITKDGHIVGFDGFVVPLDFAEFFDRFPRHVRSFVRRRTAKLPEHDRQERESELLLFLLTLPEDSKYRRPGVNGRPEGCTDRIMTFCPERSYGASAGRFFSYVNLILLNHLISLEKKYELNPVARKNTFRLTSEDADTMELGGLDEAGYHQSSSVAYSQTWLESRKVIDYVCVSRYFDFVKAHNSELIPILNAIASASVLLDAQVELGMDDQLFSRARRRLRVLHRSFTTGAAVPTQRRVYRLRKHAKLGAVDSAGRPASV